MTCAQGLLRLLWGGPKLECYGTDCGTGLSKVVRFGKSGYCRNTKILAKTSGKVFKSAIKL